MTFLYRIFAIFAIAIRRLISQRGLASATALGLIASAAIVMSIPLYTDAVYYRVLQQELVRPAVEGEMQRPPFAFMYRYVGSLYGLKQWEDIEQVDTYLTEQAPDILGLPQQIEPVRYVRTDNFRLFPTAETAYADVRDPMAWINFAFAGGVRDRIHILEGDWPATAVSDPNASMEILISRNFAEQFGIQVGEEYMTFRRTEGDGVSRNVQVPVHIAGVWQAVNPSDPYWFYRQSVFDNQFFIPEESFRMRLVPLLSDEIAQALWYIVKDGSEVNSSDVGWLLSRISTVSQQAASLLPNTRLEVSPQDSLVRYRQQSTLLNVLLYAFSIPIIGLLLAFIGLVVSLSVNRQRNEIAVLRSRGATIAQVMGIAGLEALLLGSVALAAGLPVSQQIAHLIGATRSFLNFTVDSDLRVSMTLATMQFGVIAVIVTMIAQVFPSLGASKHTIITYKQEQGRTIRPPWWQRAYLDVLLMIPTIYGTYLLRQQGTISLPGSNGSGGPFDNPLLFLVPALGALASTLLVLRLLPMIMSAVSWLASKSSSVGFLLAARYLARDPAFYTPPLVLLILTLSLSTFTASLAQTLDTHLYDQHYYQLGADAQLVELGQTTMGDSGAAAAPESTTGSGASGQNVIQEERWVFIPVSEHLNVPEIEAVARVGDYTATIQAQGRWTEARYMGVDRLDFPKVAVWRYDFAPASLGALMNSLAVASEGILLPGEFMRRNAIAVGDPIQVRVSSYGQRAEMTMQVVGEFNLFPTYYPQGAEPTPLIVGNLEHYFDYAGGQVPYGVWAKTHPATDFEQLRRDLREYDITVLDYRSTRDRIQLEQQRPERQGLFGVLSVGFLAAALLTVLGFFLYALFSFRRRFIELGTLRAIGLSAIQMTAFLAWELAFLVLLGLGAGTVLGAGISNIFIPFLQVGTDTRALFPPYMVEIAWPAITRIYMLFGLLFIGALSILAVMLLRMKVFQAIKLGETL